MTSTATPRDDIGLSERLRDEHTRILDLWEERRKAANQLDALQARVKELEAERDQMAEVLASPLADKVVEYADRATRAEQQRDEAYERAAKVADKAVSELKLLMNHRKVADAPHAAECATICAKAAGEIAAAIRRLAAGDEEGKNNA